jgi:adenylate cyclase
MEQDTAILIADLSGYTALTETHGALSAADLIDKYVEIIDESLVGDSIVHERVGDEVMIVSPSSNHLLLTAINLHQKALQQYKFLPMHGGLHYGKLLKRNNCYFGAALNLTARIASHAKAGTFLCSVDFINSLPHDVVCTFISRGKFIFKNVSEEKELFEIITDGHDDFQIDPVCRMIVKREEGSLTHPTHSNVLFCSENCLHIYLKNEAGELKQQLNA